MSSIAKSQVLKEGRWPSYFYNNLLSPVPDIRCDWTKVVVAWECPKHGKFEKTLSAWSRSESCPECARLERVRQRALNERAKNPFPQWFIDDLEGSPDKEAVLECHLSVNDYALFNCKEHGLYRQKITHHLTRHDGCPKCGWDSRRKSQSRTLRKNGLKNEDYLRTSPDYHDGISMDAEIKFVCPVHGEYTRIVRQASHYPGCLKCNRSESTQKTNLVLRRTREIPQYILDELQEEFTYNKPLTEQWKFKCKEGHEYSTRMSDRLNGHGCPICGARSVNMVAKMEDTLAEDLRKRGIKVIQSDRTQIRSLSTGRPAELDLYLPDYKIAVELNGLYWHSDKHMAESSTYNAPGGKQNYHEAKRIACKRVGIRLMQFYEDTTNEHYQLVVDKILATCGLLQRERLMARKMNVVEVDPHWLDTHHIQKSGRGLCIGFEYNGEVIAAMQYRQAPENEAVKGTYILDRYATDSRYFVVGGIEKLMKYAERTESIRYWVSYADKTVSVGDLYEKLGFHKVAESGPDYQYVYKAKRYHKFNFRKERFKKDPNLVYFEGMTEAQLADLNNVYRIYDCGKIKYVKEIK